MEKRSVGEGGCGAEGKRWREVGSLGLQAGATRPWATRGWAWEVQEAGLAIAGPEIKRAGLSLLYIIL